MKIIVGLGNPGKNYCNNRHNIGFKVADSLAQKYGAAFKRSIRQKAWLAQAAVNSGRFLFVKPRAYMNNSGACVSRVLAANKASLSDLLVVYDDADLPLGTLRLKRNGSSAGHRGIASVMEKLATERVSRLKVGIGRPENQGLTGYVLSDFRRKEENKLAKAVDKASEASINWFEDKKERTIRLAD